MSNNKHWELLSLDRHFVWADHFKREYYRLRPGTENIVDLSGLMQFFLNPTGMNMCYWYATLYIVLEGLDDYQMNLSEIAHEITDIKDGLRLFRNVIYHHQPAYLDKRIFTIMQDKQSRLKIIKVHEFLDRKLKEEMKSFPKNIDPKTILEGLI